MLKTSINQTAHTHTWICPLHNPTPSTPSQSPLPTLLLQPPPPQQPSLSPLQSSPTPRHTQNNNITKLNTSQCNLNGINNKIEELKDLMISKEIAISTVQESKLTAKSKTPAITGYTTIR